MRLKEIKDIKTFDPTKSTDMQLADDWRILGAWWTTLKEKGEFVHTKKQILDALVKNLSEMIRRGKIKFHSNKWKETPRELYLEGFRRIVDKGLYLTLPHGQLVAEGTKKGIIKLKKFITGNFYLLTSGKKAYGFIRLNSPKEIGLDEFEKLLNKHQISEQERISWWKNKESFFFYPIKDFIGFKEPVPVSVPKDVQIFFDTKLKRIAEARHRRDQCMECSKPPVYEVLWAEGMAHAFFCEDCFKTWAFEGDGKGEVNSVKEIKESEASKNFKDNTNPNIWNADEGNFKEGIRPAFGSPGGEKFLSKQIVSFIPEHKIYVEPFVGGGAVFFSKKPSKIEVINDIDSGIISAYKFIKNSNQSDVEALKNMDWKLTKDSFEKVKASNPQTMEEKFHKFIFTRWGSFSSRGDKANPLRINQEWKGIENLPKLKERLRSAEIYSKDYKDILSKYDSKESFAYLDPPYPDSSNFEDKQIDISELSSALKKYSGLFILSLPDNEKIKSEFSGFNFMTIKAGNKIGEHPWIDVSRKELLISNFLLRKVHLYEQIDFKPDEWTPQIYMKASEEQLIKMHDKLFDLWVGRGSRKNDELVINADALMISELTKRSINFKVNELDKIVKSDLTESEKIDRRAQKIMKKIQEVGPVLWIENFVTQTGSKMFAEKRKPEDADWVVRSKELPTSLVMKLERISQDIYGEPAHLIAEATGPNWRWMGLYDLVLVPKKETSVHEVDDEGFKKRFYQSIEEQVPRAAGPELRKQAKQSADEDDIKLFRFFLMQKPTKGAKPNQRMTIDSFLNLIDEDDYPVFNSKKYDGMAIEIHSDGKGKVMIFSEDGEIITERLPKTVEEIKEVKKSFIAGAELERWIQGRHQPREASAGYVHAKTPPDDSQMISNLFTCLYYEGKALHKEDELVRQKTLKELGIKQSTWEKPNMKFRLNLVPNLTSTNKKELREHTEKVRKLVASEGNVLKKSEDRYYLDGNARDAWIKFHNNAVLFGIVLERIPTKVPTTFNYRYGLDPGRLPVKPGDLTEVKGKNWLETGKSFSTDKKKERGDIIAIEFETFNYIHDKKTDTYSVSAWAPRFIPLENVEMKVPTQPDKVEDVVEKARKERVLQIKHVMEDGGIIYESVVRYEDIDFMSTEEFVSMTESQGLSPEETLFLLKVARNVPPPPIEIPVELKELFKKNPKDYPKNYAVMLNHFRGRSVHADFRRKQNGFLEGETLMNAHKDQITEEVDTLEKGRKWNKVLLEKGKFTPDMDPNKKVVMVQKEKQPLEWLNVREVVLEPESVGATKFEPGVFITMDDGMAYPGVMKPFFKEFFLDMKHFKGRMVERLIPVGKEWEKIPKEKMIWQCWTNLEDQQPYLLSKRGRQKKDYAPPDGESGLPPEWEKKVKPELRWWEKKLSRGEKIKMMDEAFNDLVDREEIKARKLKEAVGRYLLRRHWWRGPIVVRGVPVEHYDLLIDTGKDFIDEWNIEKNPLVVEVTTATRKKCDCPTPSGKSFKEWMTWEGSIAPKKGESVDWTYKKVKIISKVDDNFIVEDDKGEKLETKPTLAKLFKTGDRVWLDPRNNIYRDIQERGEEQGNPNKVLPAFMEIIDSGTVNWIEDTEEFASFKFEGKELKGYWIMKRVSPGAEIAVFKKGVLPKTKGS